MLRRNPLRVLKPRTRVCPTALKWSADAKTVYCVAWTWPDAPDDEAHKHKEKQLKDAKSKAVVIDDAQFRYFDKWIADGKRPFVFAVDVATGQHKNLLHGTGFYLIRDDSLNAANPFSAIGLAAVGLPGKPKDRRQQFGASLGGAIKKDKLFYFLNYEGQKRNFPMAVVPGSSTFFNSACFWA